MNDSPVKRIVAAPTKSALSMNGVGGTGGMQTGRIFWLAVPVSSVGVWELQAIAARATRAKAAVVFMREIPLADVGGGGGRRKGIAGRGFPLNGQERNLKSSRGGRVA